MNFHTGFVRLYWAMAISFSVLRGIYVFLYELFGLDNLMIVSPRVAFVEGLLTALLLLVLFALAALPLDGAFRLYRWAFKGFVKQTHEGEQL